MFRTGFLSLIRSLVLYTHCIPTLASGILMPLANSQQNLYDIYLLLCIQY